MIAMLEGTLKHHVDNRGVLAVGGVGYEVFATAGNLARWQLADGAVTVHISTQVREDAITLYGFHDDAERRSFLALLTVSGVGPKVALAALDALGTSGLASAVESDDVRALCQISGVGKKTAQRLALELKGRLAVSFDAPPQRTPTTTTPDDPLPAALTQLGYTRAEIERAQSALDAQGVARDADVGQRLRAALQVLGR